MWLNSEKCQAPYLLSDTKFSLSRLAWFLRLSQTLPSSAASNEHSSDKRSKIGKLCSNKELVGKCM